MDIYTVLPDLDVSQFASVLRATENARITVKDLLISDVLEIAKRTRLPVIDVRRCVNVIVNALHRDLGFTGSGQTRADELGEDGPGIEKDIQEKSHPCPEISFISTLDPIIDETLGGGIATRYLTEIAGESASGKTQLLLQLLLSVQLPPPYGLSKNAIYLSTESELPTERLVQLLSSNCVYSDAVDDAERPCLDNIYSVTAVDLETQNHILEFQVPIMVERCNIGLVVVDSIAANYRGELSSQDPYTLVERAWQLKHLGHLLQTLAAQKNVAVVVSNQVYDHWNDVNDFEDYPAGNISSPAPGQTDKISGIQRDNVSGNSSPLTPAKTVQNLTSSPLILARDRRATLSSTATIPQTPDNKTGDNKNTQSPTISMKVPPLQNALSLDYQQPFFTGFGKPGLSTWKTPALGVVWTNQVACRIVLTKEDYEIRDPPSPPRMKFPSKDAHPKLAAIDTSQDHSGANEKYASVINSQDKDSHNDANLVQESEAASTATISASPKALQNLSHQPPDSPSDEYFRTERKRTLRVVFSPWAPAYLSSQETHVPEAEGHGSPPLETADNLYVIEFGISSAGPYGVGRVR